MTTLKTTYTKLRNGAWGIRSEDDSLVPGDFVNVTKKDGSVNTEEVGKIIAKGDQGVIAEIVPSKRKAAPVYRKASGKCRASGCSEKATDRGYCASCAFDEFDN